MFNHYRLLLTYDTDFPAPSRTVALFVSCPTRVHSRVVFLLHRADDERAIELDFLADVFGQLSTATLPVNLLDWVTSNGAFQVKSFAGNSGHLRDQSNVGQSVNVETSRVNRSTRTILNNARILPAIFDHHMCDVDVSDDVAMRSHILPYHKPNKFES